MEGGILQCTKSILLPILLLKLFATFFSLPVTSDLVSDKQTLKIINTQFGNLFNNEEDPCTWDSINCSENAVVNITLESSGLKGIVTPIFCDLHGLTYLSLFNNSLQGDLSVFTTCTSLLHLDPSNNFFEGQIPTSISNLKSLRFLDLSYNNLTGTIVKELGFLPDLTFLSLSYNPLQGSLPESIVTHTNLKHIDVSYCPLDTQISYANVDASRILPAIEEFEIFASNIIGELRDVVSPRLSFLSLSENNITGRIPHAFLTSTSMVTLYLWQNKFDGTIVELYYRRERD